MSALTSAAPANRSWKSWNEKIHVYLGLYFLVFLWLFALSGLLLNHGWQFAEFWAQRRESRREEVISPSSEQTDLLRARDLMRQLGLSGEIEWTATRPTSQRFDFRVERPGRTVEVRVDLTKRSATVQEIRVNGWGVFRALHTFTGTRVNAREGERDWWLTKLWSLSMDALSIGLIMLVATSIVLAVQRREKWIGCAVAAGLGITACAFFVVGLRLL